MAKTIQMTTLEQLHSKLRANYKFSGDEDSERLCKGALKGLLAEIGEDRLKRCVESMIANENFFQVANLRKWIPAAQYERISCNRCRNNEGWLYVQIEGERTYRLVKCKHDRQSETWQTTIADPNYPNDPNHRISAKATLIPQP